jgi:hypothetical protein
MINLKKTNVEVVLLVTGPIESEGRARVERLFGCSASEVVDGQMRLVGKQSEIHGSGRHLFFYQLMARFGPLMRLML